MKIGETCSGSSTMHWNLANEEDFGSLKFLKLKYSRWDQIIQSLCRIGCPQEIRSPLFNLKKFSKVVKSAAESSTMHWNLMNDEGLGPFKLVKLKYRRGDQIIQPFYRIGPLPKILGPPSLIWWNFENLWNVLLNLVECIKI